MSPNRALGARGVSRRACTFGIRRVRISGFRSARSVDFEPGPICALVGGPSVGKSNVLAAIWTLLEHAAPSPAADDISRGGAGAIRLGATLADGAEITLEASPPARPARSGRSIAVVFLPAAERSGRLLAETGENAAQFAKYFAGSTGSSTGTATSLLGALRMLCEARVTGLLLLIEEPELFLRPPSQRHLYRLLRIFSEAGNQVLYSTHAPAFLNVGRLEELALVEHRPPGGTTIVQPEPLPADESFRAVSEVDAERSELFLARAVLLVEGLDREALLPVRLPRSRP